ncbi:hypothetical protein [Mesorhizobium sp. WSM3862]|uniref:hypothetical protein n=1 Tax=Mesorhizobium sp. WSM3862 TaxID=632858 RepID=UPI000BAFC403|nr:hypothetical protein [Mesorhizobium sp. WSM3862]PBB98370.1 hypothetical protein CK224_09815 [Mesorhizobium sp. WSM3862]
MRFVVTPEFTTKLTQVSPSGLRELGAVIELIETREKSDILVGSDGVRVRTLSERFITFEVGEYTVFTSLESDQQGEYLLLLDLSSEESEAGQATGFPTANDPRRNMMLDPNKNVSIDPRRNMLVDPNRNMMIDPNRNMMIDPNRNMMIDPNRNMMIDPNRNMMIDPNRNMSIDPRRNMMIDPRRNRYYGGPFVYDTKLNQEGFLVRANDEVSLIFDMSGKFAKFIVKNGSDGANVFDTKRKWVEFLIKPEAELFLRFGLNRRWLGIVV